MSNTSGFRYDINGLRAWAVIAVVLFHFGIPGFSGGFVGVDIFFVISGYLMTGILLKGLVNKDTNSVSASGFSILRFYMARARRIFPALAVLCAVLLIIGWFYLAPRDYRELARESARAVLFASNFLYLKQDGYFDSSAHEKMLLHTWSLSVEWQFYVVFPLALLLLARIFNSLKIIYISIWVVFFVSLLASFYFSIKQPTAAFYMLYTRIWEMLAGGLVFMYAPRMTLQSSVSSKLNIVGVLLIVFSIFFFNSSYVWPGWYAIFPVLGTVLVIVANKQNSIFTRNYVMIKIGGWSYSIYLWHWPLVVTLVYIDKSADFYFVISAIFASVILGFLSFALVETPTRNILNRKSNKLNLYIFVFFTIVLYLVSSQVRRLEGVPDRLPDAVLKVFDESNINPRFKECHVQLGEKVPECTYGGEQLGVIVIGDSHAASVVRAVEQALPTKEQHVLDWTLSGCPTIAGIKSHTLSDYMCGDFVEEKIKHSEKLDSSVPLLIVNRLAAYIIGPNEPDRTQELANPDLYISKKYYSRNSNYYQEISDAYVETLCTFSSHRDVYVLRPIPELKTHVPRTMGRELMYTGFGQRVSISLEEYLMRNEIVIDAQNKAAEMCGVKILEVQNYLCDNALCYGDKSGIPVYYDDDHLNNVGGELFVEEFKKIFQK